MLVELGKEDLTSYLVGTTCMNPYQISERDIEILGKDVSSHWWNFRELPKEKRDIIQRAMEMADKEPLDLRVSDHSLQGDKRDESPFIGGIEFVAIPIDDEPLDLRVVRVLEQGAGEEVVEKCADEVTQSEVDEEMVEESEEEKVVVEEC